MEPEGHRQAFISNALDVSELIVQVSTSSFRKTSFGEA